MSSTRVLFLCTHNSARSQIAEALLRSRGRGAFEVESAGTEATLVRPHALTVLSEIGIDASAQTSKTLHQFLDEPSVTQRTMPAPSSRMVASASTGHCQTPQRLGGAKSVSWRRIARYVTI
jgi:protein-tyrosine-phosphatase